MYLKFSIITVVKNGMDYLEDSIRSFELQNYTNKELIIVYSKSQDGTDSFLKKLSKHKIIFDKYSTNKFGSLNLGLKHASGDYIGIMHADDIFFSNNTLSDINKKIINLKYLPDLIHGNVIISDRTNILNVKRVWIDHDNPNVKNGWMPAHTSLFVSSKFKNIKYDERYTISSDYDYILNICLNKKPLIYHLNNFITLMRSGGDSSEKLLMKTCEDISIQFYYFKLFFIRTLFFKILRKFKQFFYSDFRIIKTKYLSNFLIKNYKIKSSFTEKFLNNNSFILSACNLAFFKSLNMGIINKNHILWPDGLFSKYFIKNLKLKSGSELCRELIFKINKLKNKENIYFIGNITKNIKNISRKNLNNNNLFYINYPYKNIQDLLSITKKITFLKNPLIFLILPTPKQEIIANYIFNLLNKKAKVFCVGGGMLVYAGDEARPPLIFDKLNIRFLWRLQNDLFRRFNRLLATATSFIVYHIFKPKIKVIKY